MLACIFFSATLCYLRSTYQSKEDLSAYVNSESSDQSVQPTRLYAPLYTLLSTSFRKYFFLPDDL